MLFQRSTGQSEMTGIGSMTESAAHGKIQVLVVDDSAVVRQVLDAVLSQEPDMAVSVASDPIIALQKMSRGRPDVICAGS